MSNTIIYQVDSFTSEPFKGNPAGICVLKSAADVDWMQKVAREMNLSETAFAYPEGGIFNIRFFTPKTEVDLCGHATLATAHILWQEGYVKSDTIVFQAENEKLSAQKAGKWIEIEFPSKAVSEAKSDTVVAEALGVEADFIGKNDMFHLVEVSSEEVVRNANPDFGKLAEVTRFGAVITSRSKEQGYDCVSRCFFPNLGINEDPGTGVAHCAIGPYWCEKLDKRQIMAFQASDRSSVLRVGINGDRVKLGGQAVSVMHCQLCI